MKTRAMFVNCYCSVLGFQFSTPSCSCNLILTPSQKKKKIKNGWANFRITQTQGANVKI